MIYHQEAETTVRAEIMKFLCTHWSAVEECLGNMARPVQFRVLAAPSLSEGPAIDIIAYSTRSPFDGRLLFSSYYHLSGIPLMPLLQVKEITTIETVINKAFSHMETFDFRIEEPSMHEIATHYLEQKP